MAPRRVRFDAAAVKQAEEGSKKRSAVSSDEEDDESGVPLNDDDPFARVVKKKARRRGSDEEDEDGPTEISKQTSLEAEGIPIEPFHMKNENSDGTGFFDGDTYVFRKHVQEEPDAWLDQLDDDQQASSDRKDSGNRVYDLSKIKPKDPAAKNMDDWSEADLYSKIRPCLANDDETIMQAITRYGALLNTGPPKARQIAKEAFDSLTEAASAMMLRGKINVYQMKRSELTAPSIASTQMDSSTPSNMPVADGSDVQWEYRGSADGQIHGPYKTQDMLNWIKAGYFVGPSAVQVRSIETSSGRSEATATSIKSTEQDLLSDLLDDEDDTDGMDEAKTESASYTTRGEWKMSDQVNFAEFLSE